MNYVAVPSSNIAAIAYDEASPDAWRALSPTGREYWYHRVPGPVYQGLAGAESKGRYFGDVRERTRTPARRCDRMRRWPGAGG